MQKVYAWSRNIHRTCALFMIPLGLIILVTGLGMKYPLWFLSVFPSVDIVGFRTLHNAISPFIGIILGIMMLTGTVMYLYPLIIRWKSRQAS